MTQDPLALPVAASIRSTETLQPEDSIERAATLLRESAYPFVPICHGERYVSAVSESSLAKALGDGVELHASVTEASERLLPILPSATGAEALRRLHDHQEGALLVVDENDHVIGVLSASDLVPQPYRYPAPPSIGGMATPFGVYLTTGVIHGGANQFALASSGALLFTTFLIADQIGEFAYRHAGHNSWMLQAANFVPLLVFFVAMRLMPISGTHAAEHMVVHAIERGEELTPEIVRRMPRVHPRCGTNLAVAATLFLTLFDWEWIADQELRMIVAFLATFLLFRPLGSLVQSLITTKPPNDKQLASGIRAGKELLERYRLKRGPQPNPFQRIVNSGMLHVMAGSISAYLVVKGIVVLFKLPIDV